MRISTFTQHIFRWDTKKKECLTTDVQVTSTTYPNISTILNSWLYSELPGNKGNPKNNSATIQPKDHMSIEAVYLRPNKTSGDL